MAELFTLPFAQALDSDGNPISGATLTFYKSGTATLATIYASDALTTTLANPITANAAGRFAPIYLAPEIEYRAVLKDAGGTTINDADPVAGSPGIGGISVKQFGAVGNGTTDDTAAIQAAIDAMTAPGGLRSDLWFPAGKYLITGQITVPSGVSLRGSGKWSTILFVQTSFNLDGVVKFNGTGGPPSGFYGFGIVADTGGAGAASVGLNVQANGTFIGDLWCNGFATNVILSSTDVFLSDFAVEEARTGGTGILVDTTSVSISNGTLYNCYIGLNATQTNSTGDVVLVSNVRAAACTYATFVSSGNGTHFDQCTSTHNGIDRMGFAGFWITGLYNKAIGCTVTLDLASPPHPTGIGFLVEGTASDLILQGNSCRRMLKGFVLNATGADRVVCTGNSASENKISGFEVTGLGGLIFSNNYSSNNGTSTAGDTNIKLNSTTPFALWAVTGNFAVQPGGGPAPVGFNVNLTDNGASSGKMNFGLNASEQHTSDYTFTGLTANITQTANI